MIDKLIKNIKKTEAPICLGLDPKLSYIPNFFLAKEYHEKGLNLDAAASAIFNFNKAIIDATYDIIPSVKIQIAMYEELGIPGMEAYIKTTDYAREKGLVVIGDIKRGDIGSTCASYANAHLGTITLNDGQNTIESKSFDTDFVTVNPYMGSDGIKEFLNNCQRFDRGIFVLLKTSNPSSAEFQDLLIADEKLYEKVAAKIGEWGEASIGQYGYNDVGAVVGATYPEVGLKLRKMLPHTYFLVPGYGAQGASAAELGAYFNEDGLGAIINSSRGIICAYKKEEYAKFGEEAFADAARAATLDMIKDLRTNALNIK